jgi:hypothetical protein
MNKHDKRSLSELKKANSCSPKHVQIPATQIMLYEALKHNILRIKTSCSDCCSCNIYKQNIVGIIEAVLD